MKYILILLITFSFQYSFGQTDTTKLEKDTLLDKLLGDLPKEMYKDIIAKFSKLNAGQKKETVDLMSFLSSMPKSSKKELIQNIDSNYSNILAVKTFFKNLVPKSYIVYIEFEPKDTILKMEESIDFGIFHENEDTKNKEIIFQEWGIELNSTKLDSLLQLTPLNKQDLLNLQQYLEIAKCISVSNEEEFEIGFARSGLGKYSYLIFDHNLSTEDQLIYNNGCEYIFHRNNIVLKYGGGAIGSQCFPDSE